MIKNTASEIIQCAHWGVDESTSNCDQSAQDVRGTISQRGAVVPIRDGERTVRELLQSNGNEEPIRKRTG